MRYGLEIHSVSFQISAECRRRRRSDFWLNAEQFRHPDVSAAMSSVGPAQLTIVCGNQGVGEQLPLRRPSRLCSFLNVKLAAPKVKI